MASIFLSYASEDRSRLAPLVEGLEAAGLSVFWDREIPPGSSWRRVLDKELTEASCVLVAWSRHSIESDWVLEEAESGKGNGRLIPILLDDVQMPIGFRALQALNLTKWSGSRDDEALGTLLQELRQRTSLADSLQPQLRNLPPARPRRKKPGLLLGGAVLVALVATLGAWSALREDGAASTNSASPSASRSLASPSASAQRQEAIPKTEPKAEELKYRRIYFENFQQRQGLAESVWPIGRKGDWKGELAKGEFRLCNVSGAGTASFTSALRYSEGNVEGVDQSNVRVNMTLRLEPPVAKYAATGIMFRKTKDGYYAFALTAGHSVMFVRTQGGKLKILSTWTLDGIQDGAEVSLKVEGHGDEIRLFVRDKLVDKVSDPGGHGDPGVFAMGNGCARIDEMSVLLPNK